MIESKKRFVRRQSRHNEAADLRRALATPEARELVRKHLDGTRVEVAGTRLHDDGEEAAVNGEIRRLIDALCRTLEDGPAYYNEHEVDAARAALLAAIGTQYAELRRQRDEWKTVAEATLQSLETRASVDNVRAALASPPTSPIGPFWRRAGLIAPCATLPHADEPASSQSPSQAAQATQPINQCDGCRRGLTRMANGMHCDRNSAYMVCTADEYGE